MRKVNNIMKDQEEIVQILINIREKLINLRNNSWKGRGEAWREGGGKIDDISEEESLKAIKKGEMLKLNLREGKNK